MSNIVTPDGKVFDSSTLQTLGQEEKVKRMYEMKESGIRMKTDDKPKDALDRALMQVRESYGNQMMMQLVSEGTPKDTAYLKAQALVSNMANPFHMEPAARAVFLAMAMEVHYLRDVVGQLASRLSTLDGKELEDPGPMPEAQ